MESRGLENSNFLNQLQTNFNPLDSVAQVLPIIRKIVPLAQICQFSKSLAEANQESYEVNAAVEKSEPAQNLPDRFQMIRKDFEAIQYFSDHRSVVRDQPEANFFRAVEFEEIPEAVKRKSVICHTSETKRFC